MSHQLSDLFHEPYLNNLHLVFVNKEMPLPDSVRCKAIMHKPLNDAITPLYKYIVQHIRQNSSEFDRSSLQRLSEIMQIWRSHMAKHNIFLVVDCLKAVHSMFPDHLWRLNETARDIISPITEIPCALKGLVQISYKTEACFLEQLTDSFAEVCREQLIESVEILRKDVTVANKSKFEIRVTLNYEMITGVNQAVIDRLHPIVHPSSPQLSDLARIQKEDYFFMLNPSIAIFQGYVRYKDLLKCLNALNQVYDHESNYAFLKN